MLLIFNIYYILKVIILIIFLCKNILFLKFFGYIFCEKVNVIFVFKFLFIGIFMLIRVN